MYKLEMHLHTLNQSPCAQTDEKTIAEIYHKNGYDGIVCTNHYGRNLCEFYYNQGTARKNAEYWLGGYLTLKKECEKYGIDVFLGMELMLDCLDYGNPQPPYAELLIYGLSADWLIEHPYALFPMSQKKVFELCREKGWILAQSHPYRNNITVQNPDYLEGVEAYNGHPGHENRNPLAYKFATDNNLIMTAGSDFHVPGMEGSGVALENRVGTNEELVAELRRRKHTIIKRDGVL